MNGYSKYDAKDVEKRVTTLVLFVQRLAHPVVSSRVTGVGVGAVLAHDGREISMTSTLMYYSKGDGNTVLRQSITFPKGRTMPALKNTRVGMRR